MKMQLSVWACLVYGLATPVVVANAADFHRALSQLRSEGQNGSEPTVDNVDQGQCASPCACCEKVDARPSECVDFCKGLVAPPILCQQCASLPEVKGYQCSQKECCCSQPKDTLQFCLDNYCPFVSACPAECAEASIEALRTNGLETRTENGVHGVGGAGIGDGAGVFGGQAEAATPKSDCPSPDCCCGRASEECTNTVCTTVQCPDFGNAVSSYCILADDGSSGYQAFLANEAEQDCCCILPKPSAAGNGVACNTVTCQSILTQDQFCSSTQ